MRELRLACQHRSVSKDGHTICQKIIEGNREVSPNICRDCPFKTVDCAHLRLFLRLSSSPSLIVRFSGWTEVWDDGPLRQPAAAMGKAISFPTREQIVAAD